MSKYKNRKKIEYTLSEESAQAQVCELLEYYDIDIEAIGAADEKTAAGLEMSLDAVARAFRTGQLEIDMSDEGKMQVKHTLMGGEVVTYQEVSSKAKLAMEKVNPKAQYSRIYAFMGSLAGVGKAGIEKYHIKDLAIVECLGTVFSNA